jgi:apolipoprotein N-acyltransferase
MTGVPLVRATANGTSAIFDAAGRVIECASAFDGPGVVVADVVIPTA